MTLRTGRGHRHHARSFQAGEVFGGAGRGGHLIAVNQAIKQSSKKVFSSQRNKGERPSARRSKDFALRARIWTNFARSATTCLLRGLDRPSLFLCDKNTFLIIFLITCSPYYRITQYLYCLISFG